MLPGKGIAPRWAAIVTVLLGFGVLAAPVASASPLDTGGSLVRHHAATPAAPATPSVPVEAVPLEGTADGGREQTSPDGPVRPQLCSGHPVEYGDWVNADPNARGIARVELRDCQPVTVCDGTICRIVHDAGWTMHVFGKCSPANCDWGWSKPEFRLSSGHIYGFYDQGFAKRYVYAMMSQYRPGQLWVYWRTDFVDPNRPDYEMQEWFHRA